MKHEFSVSERNALVEQHLWCIKAVMKQNRALIRAARLDPDDVYQQLALRLIRAVMSFDPNRGKLEQHIFAQLQYELRSCKRPYLLHGMTGLPRDHRGKIISLDDYRMEEVLCA